MPSGHLETAAWQIKASSTGKASHGLTANIHRADSQQKEKWMQWYYLKLKHFNQKKKYLQGSQNSQQHTAQNEMIDLLLQDIKQACR